MKRPHATLSLRNSSPFHAFGIEQLESRCLLAGMVQVSVNRGVLVVTGDSAANQFTVDDLNVTGQNGTQVTFDSSYFDQRDSVVSYTISSGAGEDHVILDNLTARNGTIWGGAGGDSIEVEDSDFEELAIYGGSGLNEIRLTYTSVGTGRGHVLLVQNDDNGSRTVLENSVEINGLATIENAGGHNDIRMVGVSFDGDLKIENLQGSATVDLYDVRGLKQVTIDNGSRATTNNSTWTVSLADCQLSKSLIINNFNAHAVTYISDSTRVSGNVDVTHDNRWLDGFATRDSEFNTDGSVHIDQSLYVTSLGRGNHQQNVSDTTIKGVSKFITREEGAHNRITISRSQLGNNIQASCHQSILDIALNQSEVDGNLVLRHQYANATSTRLDGTTLHGKLDARFRQARARDLVELEDSQIDSHVMVNVNRRQLDANIVRTQIGGKLRLFRADQCQPLSSRFTIEDSTISSLVDIRQTSSGSTTVEISGTEMAGMRYRGGPGYDYFTMDDVNVLGTTRITTGGNSPTDSQDDVFIERSFESHLGQSTFGGNVFIKTGGGADNVFLGGLLPTASVDFLKNVTVDGGPSDMDEFIQGVFCNISGKRTLKGIEIES